MELMEDELSYNVFFFLLRNEHRKKYDFALMKCWIICVPCGDSLRDICFAEDMFDEHILRPLPQHSGGLLFTDMREQHLYKIEDNSIKLISGGKLEANHEVKILSVEKGFNNEFQPYNILVLDRPINKKWESNKRTDQVKLNWQIHSWDEAVEFLKDIPSMEADYLENLRSMSEKMNAEFISDGSKENDVREGVRQLIRDCWQLVMRRQSLALQRDERFQKLLSMSIEIYVMRFLHDILYELSGRLSVEQDALLKAKIDRLNERGVEPERMGLSAELVELATFAIVELANLDSRKSPFEKLLCLKECMNFLVADVDSILLQDINEENTHSQQDLLKNKKSKDSMNEKKSLSLSNRTVLSVNKNTPVNNTSLSISKLETNSVRTANYSSKIAQLDSEKLINLLMFIIIKTKPNALIGNLNYMKNFTWFISPTEDLMCILDIFKVAVDLILQNLDESICGTSEKCVEQKTKMGNNFSKWIDNRDLSDKMKPNLSNILKENMKFLYRQGEESCLD